MNRTASLHAIQPKSLGDYFQTLRRRRGLALTVFLSALLSAAVIAMTWPPQFRSSSTILIEQQEIPPELVRSTVNSYADQRLQVISQRVMTRANLAEIIRKYDLYPQERRDQPMEVIIERMRKDINMRTVSADVLDPRSGRPMQATIAFTLSYDSTSPQVAQNVTNELTSLYLNENLVTRRHMADQASNFIGEEAARVSEQIAVLERKLAEFKQQNIERMPELAQFNMQLADRTDNELRDVEQNMRSLRERRIYLEAQLAQINPRGALYGETGERILGPRDRLKSLRAQYASQWAIYSSEHPDLVRMRKEIAALEAEVGKDDSAAQEVDASLTAARADLAEARKRYGNEHPNVQRLERQVAALEKTLSEQPPAPDKTKVTPEADNPAYIQLQSQLQATDAEMASLEKKEAEVRGKLMDLERRLSMAPSVEQRYRELNREYENAWAKYKELKVKETEANLAQSLETESKGERFTLIEPPQMPEKPFKPNRMLILLLGVMLAGAAAIASASLAEALNNKVRGSDDVERVFSIPPLAAIPYIVTGREKKLKVLVRATAVVLVFVGGGLVALLVHTTIMPLEVAWFVALRRFGL